MERTRDTAIFIGRISSIFYIRYYMFRHLIIAIFRLYMKYLLSSYTKHTWAVYMRYVLYNCLMSYFMYNLKMAVIKRRNM